MSPSTEISEVFSKERNPKRHREASNCEKYQGEI